MACAKPLRGSFTPAGITELRIGVFFHSEKIGAQKFHGKLLDFDLTYFRDHAIFVAEIIMKKSK
jgi:hypothetical protein